MLIAAIPLYNSILYVNNNYKDYENLSLCLLVPLLDMENFYSVITLNLSYYSLSSKFKLVLKIRATANLSLDRSL